MIETIYASFSGFANTYKLKLRIEWICVLRLMRCTSTII